MLLRRKSERLSSEVGKSFTASIPMIGFVIFGLIPLALACVMAFSEMHVLDFSTVQWVKFENFFKIFTNEDKRTYGSYLSTFVFSMSLPVCIIFSMWIGYLISKVKKGVGLYSVILFIPSVCSVVVATSAFVLFFREEGGALNSIISALGFKPRGWLTQSNASYTTVIYLLIVWLRLGMMVTLFGAAFRNVDKTYSEAAMLDGASERQVFWKITLPAISPTIGYLVTFGIIGNMQMMMEPSLLVTGNFILTWGTSEAWVSDTVVKHIYNMIYLYPTDFGFGMAAAAGLVLAVVVLIVTQINLRAQKRLVNYDY